jgi:hypothetical protein
MSNGFKTAVLWSGKETWNASSGRFRQKTKAEGVVFSSDLGGEFGVGHAFWSPGSQMEYLKTAQIR